MPCVVGGAAAVLVVAVYAARGTGAAGGLIAGLIAAAIRLRIVRARQGPRVPPGAGMSRAERSSWRMPPLALLRQVAWSPGTKLSVLLRGYLVVSVVLLAVAAVRIGTG